MFTACLSPRDSKLAQACSAPEANVTIASDGVIAWNGTHLISDEDLYRCMKIVATTEPRPEVRMRAGADLRYASAARFFNAAQRAGLKVKFIIEPK
jgi:biopolymer transport protein ExbD